MKKVLLFLNTLLKKEDTVVIALSGGPDSMCLLSLLLQIPGIKIVAAHVNHNIREESKEEALFVKKYCEDNKVIFESMIIEQKINDNFENVARSIRYSFFNEILKKYQAHYLMTAHHGDDLMETILMRMVRGSSLEGYAGFKKITYEDGYKIVRPLVELTKSEIELYNKENNIPYVIDKSNFKDDYTRNRYRKYVLPFLKKEDKKVNLKFLKFSKELNDYNNYVESKIFPEFKKIYQNRILNLNKFLEYDSFTKRQLIEMILKTLYPDNLFLVSDIHTEKILLLIENNKASGKLCLPEKNKVLKTYDKVYFLKNEADCSYNLLLSDFNKLSTGTIKKIKESNKKSNYVTRLLSDELKLPLYIRTRKLGDKISVKKLDGHKKIKGIFIDTKIKTIEREEWPLVCDADNNVIWVPGLKKSKFDKEINEKYDIILEYVKKER